MFDGVKDRVNILISNAKNSYMVQTAYFFENWASVLSTTFYVLTMLLFVKIVYSNVDTFAGYSEAEMLFLMFFSQLNFYADWTWNTNNILYMMDSVRTGELDLILSKPLPSLFFVTFRDISLINRLKDGLPNLIILALVVNWGEISTNLSQVLMGLIIFVLGQISWHCFRFLFALPVFFIGQSRQIFQLSGTLGGTNDIPLEGFTGNLRTVFISVIPALIAAQMSVSVILGKSNPIQVLIFSAIVTGVFLMLKQLGWIIALRNYSSASS